MPAGLFDPEFDPAQPLELPTPAKKANQWKELAPLMALLPIALAKGGRVGGAALMQGFQQARQRREQEERQAGLDAENRSYRDATLQAQRDRLAMDRKSKADADANTEAARRQTFLTQFNTGLEGIDTPEAAQAYLALQQAQGRTIGVNPDELARMIPSADVLKSKRVQKRLAQIKRDYPDTWQSLSFRDGDQVIKTVDADGVIGDTTPKPKPGELGKSSLDVQLADAYRRKRAGDPNADADIKDIEAAILKGDTLRRDPPRITVNTGAATARVDSRIDRIASGFSNSPLVKEFNETQAQYQNIRDVLSRPWSGPGDMSVVYAFMRALDPTSVVRETEYANAARSGNIFAGWAAKFNGKLNPDGGFLAPQVRQSFLSVIEGRLKTKRTQYENLRQQTKKRIDAIRGGKPETSDEALADYDAAFPEQPAAAPPVQPTTPTTKTKIGRFEVEVSQ